jgi:hypothetical protein
MCCEACRKDLEPDAPIYRVALPYSHPLAYRSSACIFRVCAACLRPPNVYVEEWWPPLPCIHCGRPILASRNRRPPKLLCCSTECNAATLSAAARRKRSVLRHNTRPLCYCKGCDKPFEPKRIDAAFCSPACRQRAYRLRLSGRRDPSDDVPARVQR